MARRILSRINSAHVIATIALFAALGGGYAAAFSGSGTLQKAGIDGLGPTFTNVRTLTGFGRIDARCDTVDNSVEIRFFNTQSSEWLVFGESNSDQQVSLGVDPGELNSTVDVASAGAAESFRLHVSRTDPDKKAQIDLTILGRGPDVVDDCDFTSLRILALNTQQ